MDAFLGLFCGRAESFVCAAYSLSAAAPNPPSDHLKAYPRYCGFKMSIVSDRRSKFIISYSLHMSSSLLFGICLRDWSWLVRSSSLENQVFITTLRQALISGHLYRFIVKSEHQRSHLEERQLLPDFDILHVKQFLLMFNPFHAFSTSDLFKPQFIHEPPLQKQKSFYALFLVKFVFLHLKWTLFNAQI